MVNINKQISKNKFHRVRRKGLKVKAYSLMKDNEGATSCLEAFTTGTHLYTTERCKTKNFTVCHKRYELRYLPYCDMVFFKA